MNDDERQELRDFIAREVMEWHIDKGGMFYKSAMDVRVGFIDTYRPDSPESPASQLLGVIEKMRERGWFLTLNVWPDGRVHAEFSKAWGNMGTTEYDNINTALPDAILLAARAALEEAKADSDGQPNYPKSGN